ncbi:MAG: MraZ N-terminal domain containing protein, partial [Ruminococcus sp.]|nr:MraZ N-terminal domain containing protein [Ruminococcus sp.]
MLDELLIGTFNQSMDAKGRLSFPAKLREALGERFIITKGIDGCLFVYSLENFERKAEKIQALPMAKARA